jgi:hypothetical protein
VEREIFSSLKYHLINKRNVFSGGIKTPLDDQSAFKALTGRLCRFSAFGLSFRKLGIFSFRVLRFSLFDFHLCLIPSGIARHMPVPVLLLFRFSRFGANSKFSFLRFAIFAF